MLFFRKRKGGGTTTPAQPVSSTTAQVVVHIHITPAKQGKARAPQRSRGGKAQKPSTSLRKLKLPKLFGSGRKKYNYGRD